jgi:hypothetical protein
VRVFITWRSATSRRPGIDGDRSGHVLKKADCPSNGSKWKI